MSAPAASGTYLPLTTCGATGSTATSDPGRAHRVPRLLPLHRLALPASHPVGIRAGQLQPHLTARDRQPRRRLGRHQQHRAHLRPLLRQLAQPHRGPVHPPALLRARPHRPPPPTTPRATWSAAISPGEIATPHNRRPRRLVNWPTLPGTHLAAGERLQVPVDHRRAREQADDAAEGEERTERDRGLAPLGRALASHDGHAHDGPGEERDE
jgi:hypothetical protein